MKKLMQLISVIIPIYNGALWMTKCFESILNQINLGFLNLEICVCDDGSTDNTYNELKNWEKIFKTKSIGFKIIRNIDGPKGVGCSKNRAISISSGDFLCFQDIDDIMLPERIWEQYHKALKEPLNTIVGSQFIRNPPNSTHRYTKWANNLTEKELDLQVFTSHGPTIIMPTWFCHKNVYNSVGRFLECKNPFPEDLVFFNTHLDLGGKIVRVDKVLLIYNFHLNQTTFSINERLIWNIRIERLQKIVLKNWSFFSIWNAGKQGRKFYNSLCCENRKKVLVFCDVDLNKIGKKYRPFDKNLRKFTDNEIDIIHFKNAKPPYVICIKMDLTHGEFEANLKKLNLKENEDYILFS